MSDERIRVLVVDDDPATLAMVEQTFASNPGLAAPDVELEGAPRKQGLAAFRLHGPDLLITDMAPSQIETLKR